MSDPAPVDLEELHTSLPVTRLVDAVNTVMNALSTSSRTNALWIQYIGLVDFLNSSIVAERTGKNNYIVY